MSNFPASLPAPRTLNPSDTLAVAQHTAHHNNDLGAELVAIATKVGVDSSAVTTTHDYKLSHVTGTNRALSEAGGTISGSLTVSGDETVNGNETIGGNLTVSGTLSITNLTIPGALTLNGTFSGSVVFPVANGGTGSSTAAGARTNLGVVNINGDTMTGALNLPGNGLLVGTNQLVANANGNVGIGVSPTSTTKLEILATQDTFQRMEIQKDGSALDYSTNRAAFVLQQRDTQTLGTNLQTPGSVFQFVSTGDGNVTAGTETSTSIWWGLQGSMDKYGDGSGQTFTVVSQLHAYGAGAYNELGGFQGTLTNVGSNKGTMSGFEMILQDSPNSGVTSFDTKMDAVIGRVAKYNTSARRSSNFLATSEGTQQVGFILNAGAAGGFNQWATGIDIASATINTGVAINLPNNTNISFKNSGGTSEPAIIGSNTNSLALRPLTGAGTIQLQNFSGTTKFQVDDGGTDAVYIWTNATLKRIGTAGADSGGAGFRNLIVVN